MVSHEIQIVPGFANFADVVLISDEEDDVGPGIPTEPVLDAWFCRSVRYRIPAHAFQALVLLGCPPVVFNLMWWLGQHPDLFPPGRDIDILEMFSGKAKIFEAGKSMQLNCAHYDIDMDGVYMDFLSGPGFLTALCFVLRMSTGGLATFATKCSSWIWLARAVTKRSKAFPMGPRNPHSALSTPFNLILEVFSFQVLGIL